ncbi:MAG: hypothetical protein AAF409_18495 [Pseudomonadota bacterium]
MAEAGGPSTQAGIFYQNSVAALTLADLLDLSPLSARERVLEVRVEAPGSVDDIVVTFADGHLDYQSVKLSLRVRNEAWSSLWKGLYAQMRSPNFGPTDQLTIVLSDRNAASDALIQLCDRANSAIDCSEFTARVMREHQTALESIEELIGDRVSVFELLRRTRILHLPDDAIEREFGRRRLAGGTQDLPALLPLLRDMVGGVSRRRGLFRGANLRRRLQNEYGVLLGEPNEWGLAAYRRSLEQTTRLNVPGTALSGAAKDMFVWPRARTFDGARPTDFEDESPVHYDDCPSSEFLGPIAA